MAGKPSDMFVNNIHNMFIIKKLQLIPRREFLCHFQNSASEFVSEPVGDRYSEAALRLRQDSRIEEISPQLSEQPFSLVCVEAVFEWQ